MPTIRRIAFVMFRPFVRFRPYGDPALRRFWQGSFVLFGRCLAFKASNGDLVFRW